MKKILLAMLAFVSFLFANNLKAQGGNAGTPRIGVFDIDIMVQAMPGYRVVDSMLQIYQQDSLRSEYEFAVKEYNRLDSTYKLDSAAKKSASVLNYQKEQRSQIATTIVYWQQISQQKSEQKRQELAAPMYEKVLGAYSKVLQANNYLVVLKPGAYEMGSKVENVFERVARELKINLPDQLKSQGAPPPAQGEEGAGTPPPPPGKGKAGTKKP